MDEQIESTLFQFSKNGRADPPAFHLPTASCTPQIKTEKIFLETLNYSDTVLSGILMTL